MTFTFDTLQIDSVTETNESIAVVLSPKPGAFPAGVLESNFRALSGFSQDEETGLITPVFEPVTLTFNGY
jgi:hypothetical protein